MLAASVAHNGATYPPQSIYQLRAVLTNQSGTQHGLDVYAGQPVLVTMFYGSCPAACPLLIDTLRAVERAAPPAQRERLRVLMISIDPQHDTSRSLQTLARTDAATVRRIAAVLNLQYRQLPDGSFNHASVITLLSPTGEILAQSTMLAKVDNTLLEAGSKSHQLSDR
jgi:protein SCO1/2